MLANQENQCSVLTTDTVSTNEPVIEYFYGAHSAFAYLGSKRFTKIARAAGRKIVHRPIDLSRVVEQVTIPFSARTAAHRAYYFGREIERWSEERGVPVLGRTPTHHSNDIALANCTLIAAVSQGLSADRLAHAFLEAHWRDDADLADRSTLEKLLAGADYDIRLLDLAGTDGVLTIYEENTRDAIARSVFGSPTYFVDGDPFYGQDRLEMVERALTRPYNMAT